MDFELLHKQRFLDCVRVLQSSGSPAAIEEASRYLSNFAKVGGYWRVCVSVLVDSNAATRSSSSAAPQATGSLADLSFSKYAEFISIKLLSNGVVNDTVLSSCIANEANSLTDIVMEMLLCSNAASDSSGSGDNHNVLSSTHSIPVNTKQLCLCLVAIIIWNVHNNRTRHVAENILPRILSVASSALAPALVSLYIFEELPLQFCKPCSSSSSKLADPENFLAIISAANEYIWHTFVASSTGVLNSGSKPVLTSNLLVLRSSLACLVAWAGCTLPSGGSCGGAAMQTWSTLGDIALGAEGRARCLLLITQRLTQNIAVGGSTYGRDSGTLMLMGEVASSAMDLLTIVLSSYKTPSLGFEMEAGNAMLNTDHAALTDFIIGAFTVTLRLCDSIAGGLVALRSQLRLRIDGLLQLRYTLAVQAGLQSAHSSSDSSSSYSISVSLVALLTCLVQNHSPVLLAGAYADARSRCHELGAASAAAPECELLLTSSLLLCLCLPNLSAAIQAFEVYTYITDVISSPASISALVEPTLAAVLLRAMYPSTIRQQDVKVFELSHSYGRRASTAGRETELDGSTFDTLQTLHAYRREGSHLLQRVCAAWDRDGSAGALLVDDCVALFSQAGALRSYGECTDPAARRELLHLAHAIEGYLFVVSNILETHDGGGASGEEGEGDRVASASTGDSAAYGRWLALLTHMSVSLEPCCESLAQHFPVVLNTFLEMWASAPLLVKRALGGAAGEPGESQYAVERLLSSTLPIAVSMLSCPYSSSKAARAISSIASHLRRHLHFCAVGVCQHFVSALPSLPSQALRQGDLRGIYCSLGALILSIPHRETLLLIASQVFTSTSERLVRDCRCVYGRWTEAAGNSMARLDGLLKGLGGYSRRQSNVLGDSIPAVTLSLLQLLEQHVVLYRGSADEQTIQATASFASQVLRVVCRLIDTFCLGLSQLEEALLCLSRVADCCSVEALAGVPTACAAAVRAMSEERALPTSLADMACAIICKVLQKAAFVCRSASAGIGGASAGIGGVVDLTEAVAEMPCESLRLVRQCCIVAPQLMLMQEGGITRGYFELLVAAMSISGSRSSASFMRVASASLSSVRDRAAYTLALTLEPSVASMAYTHMQSSSFSLLRLLLLDGLFGRDMRVARIYAELLEHSLALVHSAGGATLAASVLQAVCDELVSSAMQITSSLTHVGRDGVAVAMTTPSWCGVVCSSLQKQVSLPGRLGSGGVKKAFTALAFAAQGGDYSAQRNNNTFDYDLICFYKDCTLL